MKNFIYKNVSGGNKLHRFMQPLNEAETNAVSVKLIEMLYETSYEKYREIDFGYIQDTRGDITRFKAYDTFIQAFDTIEEISKSNNGTITKGIISELRTAMKNLETRAPKFKIIYKENLHLGQMLYESVMLAIIELTTLTVSTTIDYVKNPKADNFELIFNTKSEKKLATSTLYANLKQFNKACADLSVDQVLDHMVTKKKDSFMGLAAGVTGMLAGAMIVIAALAIVIPLIRELIYYFYYGRVRVSEHLSMISDLLEANEASVKANGEFDAKKKTKIVKKQMDISKRLGTVSNAITVSDVTADKQATDELGKIDYDDFKGETGSIDDLF